MLTATECGKFYFMCLYSDEIKSCFNFNFKKHKEAVTIQSGHRATKTKIKILYLIIIAFDYLPLSENIID